MPFFFITPRLPTRCRCRGLLSDLITFSDTGINRWDSPRRGIGPTQIPLPDNTQKSQATDIHVVGGIRTSNTSRQEAADPRLRPCGHQHPDICFWLVKGISFWLSWLSSCQILVISSRQFTEFSAKLDQGPFFPHEFQLIVILRCVAAPNECR